ncbi:MAG: hypothetical protein J6X81_02265 [Muribaculaceae bacterium]|nr:hypothetical protein [Muribaculaceae bacterium]
MPEEVKSEVNSLTLVETAPEARAGRRPAAVLNTLCETRLAVTALCDKNGISREALRRCAAVV